MVEQWECGKQWSEQWQCKYQWSVQSNVHQQLMLPESQPKSKTIRDDQLGLEQSSSSRKFIGVQLHPAKSIHDPPSFSPSSTSSSYHLKFFVSSSTSLSASKHHSP